MQENKQELSYGSYSLTRKSNDEQFGQMLVKHRNYLLTHALRLTRNNRSDAEDLVQETLLRAFDRRHTFRTAHPDSFRNTEPRQEKTWLFVILLNLFRNHCRQQRHLPRLLSWETVIELPSATADPETLLIKKREIEQARAALNALPAQYRDVLLLVAEEQFNYAEIADQLQLPIGTVRSRLFRARHHAKQRAWF